MYDVVIIGAGVVGAMTARELSRYRLKICVLEKENDVAMGATKANSAIVHAGFDAETGTWKAKLNVLGAQKMPALCQELGVKYQNNGSLVVGFNEDDREMLKKLLVKGQNNGVSDLRILEKQELQAMEPNLSDNINVALYAPTAGIVCPYELAVAAIGNAMDNGAKLMCNFEVCAIEKRADSYEIKSKTATVSARYVVNCAGLYSHRIAALAGDDSVSVHPRKGEYLLLDKECGGHVKHVVFRTPTKMGKGILVSPTVDGNLLLGPTSVDITDKENKNTTAQGLEQIMKSARETVDGVPFGKVITSFCGLRAVGNTGDFIFRSHLPGFLTAAGIESPGLSASPAIAEHLVALLRQQGLETEEKADFCPRRQSMYAFRSASREEKNRMIRENPAYGKIVCRCEGVTEGEILDALRRNPKATDLDGVKRRTRAQMGRCQGGFCSPQIMELIAREQEIPYEEVTKSGGNSRINLKKTKGGLAE